MNLFVFGLSLLLIMGVWKFMIRKSILDSTRDKLFDLRDEVRETFVKNGWDLDGPIYKKMRDLLNGHLRFTEDYSIWKISFLNSAIDRDKDLQDELRIKFERNFKTDVKGQMEFIQSIRTRSVLALMEFAVFSSGLLLTMTVVLMPFVVAWKILTVLSRGLSAASGVCVRTALNIRGVTNAMFDLALGMVAHYVMQPNWVEPYAYKMGMEH